MATSLPAAVLLCFCFCLSRPLPAVRAQPSSTGDCVAFHALPVCPAASDTAQLAKVSGAESPATCQLICGLSPACSAVHWDSSATCWLARAAQWQDKWLPADGPQCQSRMKLPTPPAGQLANGLAMWFSFRHSLVNLADTSAPPAQLVNAVRNSSGAQLAGSGGSYVAVPVPSSGFQAMVGSDNSFTYFIKVDREFKTNSYFLRASDAAQSGIVYWFEENRKVMIGNSQAHAKRFDATAEILPGTRAVVSLGATFSSSAYSVYFNGSLHATEMANNVMANGVATDLRLGYRHNDDTQSLQGRILCFGVWTRGLTLAEFVWLESEC